MNPLSAPRVESQRACRLQAGPTVAGRRSFSRARRSPARLGVACHPKLCPLLNEGGGGTPFAIPPVGLASSRESEGEATHAKPSLALERHYESDIPVAPLARRPRPELSRDGRTPKP